MCSCTHNERRSNEFLWIEMLQLRCIYTIPYTRSLLENWIRIKWILCSLKQNIDTKHMLPISLWQTMYFVLSCYHSLPTGNYTQLQLHGKREIFFALTHALEGCFFFIEICGVYTIFSVVIPRAGADPVKRLLAKESNLQRYIRKHLEQSITNLTHANSFDTPAYNIGCEMI